MKTGSLRLRIALVGLGVLTVAIIGFDIAVALVMRNALESDLSDRLTSRAAAVVADWPSVDVRALSLDGIDVAISKESSAGALGSISLERHGDLEVGHAYVGGATITLSASTDPIDRTIGWLILVEIVASLCVVAVATVLYVVVARFATRPLRDVAAVANGIAAGDHGRRLAPTETHSELGQMADAFDRMVDALEAALARAQGAEAATRRFIADASHELRTPIASVHAAAETLLRGPRSGPDRELDELRMARETARLSRLADDLLSLARLDATLPRHQTDLDLAPLVQSVVDRQRERTPGLEIQLQLLRPLPVRGDADDLSRAVANLVENAARATLGHGQVAVDAAVRADRVVVRVADNGPGVPADDRDRVFEPFVRLAGASGDGNGLGLAIVQAIARQHRGAVTCDAVESGACFSLRLPSIVRDAPP